MSRRTTKWLLLAGTALVAALVVRQHRAPADRFEPGDAAPARVRQALVDGIRMRWEEHGREAAGSTTIVFVHGLPTNPRAWRYVIPLLAQPGIRCLAWEQVGFGGSLREGLGRDLSIPAQAEYLAGWFRYLRVQKAIFVGHDYGGGVIQQLMITSPEMFSGLVLADSVAFRNWPVAAVRVARALGPALGKLPLSVVHAIFRTGLRNLGHTNAAVAAESAELFWRPYTEVGPVAFANQLSFFDNRDTSRIGRHLRPLPCPQIVVWGEFDPLGLKSARRLAHRIGAELRVIPRAYHFTLEDHPTAIADAVLSVVQHQTASVRRAGRLDE